MAFSRVLPLLCIAYEILLAASRNVCGRAKTPFEIGTWENHLVYLDSVVIDTNPVYDKEGQIYVYENSFPGFKIQYVHADNLAKRSCGASAALKQGGVGASSLMVVFHAQPGHEIRSVLGVWGFPQALWPKHVPRANVTSATNRGNVRSRYLFRINRELAQEKQLSM